MSKNKKRNKSKTNIGLKIMAYLMLLLMVASSLVSIFAYFI